jgi:hypothetical protein
LTDDRFPWERFQSRLVDAIESEAGSSDDTESRYYEQWLDALERTVVGESLVPREELFVRTGAFESGDRTAEEWVEGHHGHSHEDGHDHGH